MSITLKAACTCKHQHQDTLYGKGVRICTPIRNKNAMAPQQGRCTVCLKTHDIKSNKE